MAPKKTTTKATPAPEPEAHTQAVVEGPDGEIAAIIERHITHTDTGLIIHDTLTFEEWLKAYPFYSGIKDKTNWMLGDFLRGGEKFGERYAQAVDITGKEYSTLTTIVYVCTRFADHSRRHANLKFSWHEAVAALPPQQADHLLAEASRKKATIDREWLRDSAAKLMGRKTSAERKAEKEAKANGGTLQLLPPAANPPTLDGHVTVEPAAKPSEPQPEAPAPAQPASTPPDAPPEPKPAPAPPEPAPTADQPLAAERAEAALNRFLEESQQVDWKAMGNLAKKRWQTMLIPVDKLIDALQGNPPTPRA